MVPGPLLQIGNTTCRVDFGGDPGLWVDAWSRPESATTGPCASATAPPTIKAAASLLGIEHRHVVLS